MDKQELHDRLEKLHDELRQASRQPGDQNAVEDLRGHVEDLLQRKETAQPHQYELLAKRLRESLEKVEAAHPQAALLMGQVIEALANLGI